MNSGDRWGPVNKSSWKTTEKAMSNTPFRFAATVFNPQFIVAARKDVNSRANLVIRIELTAGDDVIIRTIDENEREATLEGFMLAWKAALASA